MHILYIGEFNIDHYSRGRVLKKGLQSKGHHVDTFGDNSKRKFISIPKRLMRRDFDVVIGRAGYLTLLLMWWLRSFYRRPFIHDQFVSSYDTMVKDRKAVDEGSWNAKYLWLQDWITCRIGHVIIFDTQQHIEYFEEMFGMDTSKAVVVPVGVDNERFFPAKAEPKYDVLFYGSFQGLHGIPVILDAARQLPDTSFHLMGLHKRMYDFVEDIDNVTFSRRKVNAQDLAGAHICLGVFGTSEKASRVIPNKVFEVLASRRLLITADVPALISVGLKHREHCVLVPPGDAQALADAIVTLLHDKKLAQSIARKGYEWAKQRAFPEEIAGQFEQRVLSRLQKHQ